MDGTDPTVDTIEGYPFDLVIHLPSSESAPIEVQRCLHNTNVEFRNDVTLAEDGSALSGAFEVLEGPSELHEDLAAAGRLSTLVGDRPATRISFGAGDTTIAQYLFAHEVPVELFLVPKTADPQGESTAHLVTIDREGRHIFRHYDGVTPGASLARIRHIAENISDRSVSVSVALSVRQPLSLDVKADAEGVLPGDTNPPQDIDVETGKTTTTFPASLHPFTTPVCRMTPCDDGGQGASDAVRDRTALWLIDCGERMSGVLWRRVADALTMQPGGEGEALNVSFHYYKLPDDEEHPARHLEDMRAALSVLSLGSDFAWV